MLQKKLFFTTFAFLKTNVFMNKQHILGSEIMGFELISTLLNDGHTLVLSKESEAAIQKCRDYLDNKMKLQEKPIYGITTGFGSLCNKSISIDGVKRFVADWDLSLDTPYIPQLKASLDRRVAIVGAVAASGDYCSCCSGCCC